MTAKELLKAAQDVGNLKCSVIDMFSSLSDSGFTLLEHYIIKRDAGSHIDYSCVVKAIQTIEAGHGMREEISYSQIDLGPVSLWRDERWKH